MGKTITFREAVREAMSEELDKDKEVIFMGEDIGVYGGAFGVSAGMFEKYGKNRMIETPISENSFVGVGVGAALAGMKPIVELMFMDFIGLAVDQICNHAAKIHYMYGGQLNVPLTVRCPSGAGRGYGASHSQSLEAWFAHIPGIKVVSPSSPYTCKGLLKSAIQDPNPVLFIENKLLYDVKEEVPGEEYYLEIGKAYTLREGKDVSLISYGRMVHLALEAAKALEEDGVDAEVIDLSTLKPLDKSTIIKSVQKTGKVVVIDEGYKTLSIGAEVSSIIAEECLEYMNGRLIRLSCADTTIPSAKHLEEMILPKTEDIIKAARNAFYE